MEFHDDKLSVETLQNHLQAHFNPRVLLINHEKRLGIDTTCANLAIKYNMLYLSVYQLIKYHVETATELGKSLMMTKREKELNLTSQVTHVMYQVMP